MRPYRALTKKGKWIKGWYCQVEARHFIILDDARLSYRIHELVEILGLIEVIPETVGQSTGHKANNKEVYAGDIISDNGIINWLVVWDEKSASFVLVDSIDFDSAAKGEFAIRPNDKVIGNIIENPTLLEKEE